MRCIDLNRSHRNFVFRRGFPIHKIFGRCCEPELLRLSADKVTRIFGWPARQRISGKRQTVLQKIEQGQHVLRAYSNSAVPRMYQKWTTLSRVEVLSNRLKDFGLNKGLENLDAVRQKLAAVSGRFAAFEAESLRTPMDFPYSSAWRYRSQLGRSRVPGIKIHDTRVPRLMEVLLDGGTQITGWGSCATACAS